MAPHLEDLQEDQTFASGACDLTAAAVQAFAAECDPQPFHLDEAALGEALEDSGAPRAEILPTTKVCMTPSSPRSRTGCASCAPTTWTCRRCAGRAAATCRTPSGSRH